MCYKAVVKFVTNKTRLMKLLTIKTNDELNKFYFTVSIIGLHCRDFWTRNVVKGGRCLIGKCIVYVRPFVCHTLELP